MISWNVRKMFRKWLLNDVTNVVKIVVCESDVREESTDSSAFDETLRFQIKFEKIKKKTANCFLHFFFFISLYYFFHCSVERFTQIIFFSSKKLSIQIYFMQTRNRMRYSPD